MKDQDSLSDRRPMSAVILAAGDSRRMKSTLTKVLHPLAGVPMLAHVVRTVETARPEKTVVVVGRNREEVRQTLITYDVELAVQQEPLGTAHALLSAWKSLEAFEGDLLVLCGDTPLIHSETLLDLIDFHRHEGSEATLLTCRFNNPSGYGRILRAGNGAIWGIVEEIEAKESEKDIREVNTGIYCFKSPTVFRFLEKLCADKSDKSELSSRPAEMSSASSNSVIEGHTERRPSKEYYLTDIVEVYNRQDLPVKGLSIDDELEVMGINTRNQLAAAQNVLRDRIRDHWMAEGVTLIDPSSVFIDSDVEIGKDTTIFPCVILEGGSKIGEGSVIGPYSRIIDSRVGRDSRLMGWNFLEEASIPEGQVLRPYSSGSPR